MRATERPATATRIPSADVRAEQVHHTPIVSVTSFHERPRWVGRSLGGGCVRRLRLGAFASLASATRRTSAYPPVAALWITQNRTRFATDVAVGAALRCAIAGPIGGPHLVAKCLSATRRWQRRRPPLGARRTPVDNRHSHCPQRATVVPAGRCPTPRVRTPPPKWQVAG